MRDFDPTASEFISSGYLERSRPGGVLYDLGSVVGAVAGPLIGGIFGSDAAGDAADTQAAAADRATQLQKQMFDKQIELQAPFRQTGLTANNRLSYLLGLSGSGGAGAGAGGGGGTTLTAEQLINTDGNWTPNSQLYSSDPTYRNAWDQFINHEATTYGAHPNNALGSTLTTGLSELARFGFDLDAYNARQQAAGQAQTATNQNDPEFGSLMRRFSAQDFQADPGYQFRMDEGMRALEGSAAARGGLLSGAAMKAIQKYGQGVASQEYGNAYSRYTADQTNQYNRLAGLVNTGMGATNQTSNAAANFANNASSNIIGAGNAAAAGQIGSANALVGGINSGINAYQNNQLMQMIRQPSPSLAGYTPTTNFNVAPANYSLY